MAQSPASSRGGSGVTVLSYVEFTSNVSVSATSAATANTVVTAAATAVNGLTVVCVEIYSPALSIAVSDTVKVDLWQDSTDLGMVMFAAVAGTTPGPAYGVRYLTPAAGSPVFSARAWHVTGASSVTAGVGGAGALMPGFIRVTSGR